MRSETDAFGNPVEEIDTRYVHDFLAYAFRRIPPNTSSLLDVGTGWGLMGCVTEYLFRFKPDGIERWGPYAQEARKYYHTLHEGDALDVLERSRTRAYDVVLCLEVLEHMETREKALLVLDQMERVGRMVICSSPNRHYDKPAADGNPFQVHRCVVPAREMRRRGYTVRGSGPLTFNFGALFRVLFPGFDIGWLAWKKV